MPIDWERLEEKAKPDKGSIRGRYRLSDADKNRLIGVLKRYEGGIVWEPEDVLAIFYTGRGTPNPQSVVTALNRNFGDSFEFFTRDRGKSIAIRLKEK
ncbi:MAG: hypothetical protein V3U52_01210 [Thermoplasmata archaeon]